MRKDSMRKEEPRMQENGFFHKLFRFLKEWLRKLLQVLFPADILTQIGHAAGEGSRRRNSDSDDLPIGAEPGEVTEEERKRMMETPVERRHIRFFGRVQGVGFRYHAMYSARNFNLTGWVANRSDGSVEMEVQGPEAAIDYMLRALQENGRWIRIEAMDTEKIPVVPNERGFKVEGY